jgi:hypothetical protein
VVFKNAARSPIATGTGPLPSVLRRTTPCPGKLVELLLCGSNKSEEGVILRFYPHFSTFLTHVTSHALSSHTTYLRAPSCASKSQDLFSPTLHSHALSYLPTHLFGSLRLCYGFLSHSSDLFVYDSLIPFGTIQLPHLVCFQIYHVSPSSEALCFFP